MKSKCLDWLLAPHSRSQAGSPDQHHPYSRALVGRSGLTANWEKKLLALTTVKEVMVSMNAGWWDWAGQVPAGRVKGGMSECTSKSKGR